MTTNDDPENLMQGLIREINRNRELLKSYKAIGQAGAFGAAFIETDIRNAEEAMGSGDVVAMMRCYKALEGNTS